MNFDLKLGKAAPVVFLALAMAGCGGGGGTTSMPEPPPPDPAIAERADINMAITAARTAVDGLTDDASDTAIAGAEMAVADAKAEVSGAANVPADEKTAFNTAIDVIERNLSTKKTSIADARKAAADAMAEAMAATGKALHAALGGPQAGGNALANNEAAPTLAAAGLTIDAAAGAGSLADATNPDAETLEAGDSAGALGSWMGTHYAHTEGTGDAKISNAAVVYINQGEAETDDFGDVHALTDGSLTVEAANVGLVKADAFTHSGTQNHAVPDRSDAFYARGTYDGAPGEYSCPTGCSSTNDGTGSPSALGGTWTFTPDMGAMVSQPDENYLYFGWWVSKDSDDDPTAASAFVGEMGDVDGTGDTSSGADLTGSATYVGHAAGKFAMSNPLDGTGNGGHFTADATLTANFGAIAADNSNGVTGTIDNFRLNDGSEDPGWSVELNRSSAWAADGAITGPTADATVWSINGNKAPASGAWSGTMYDEMPGDPPDGDGSNLPTTVTGTFYSEFSSIGRMAGAFGADKQ